MKIRGGGVYELANYGLIMGLRGDRAKAERCFAAAKWWNPYKRIHHLIEFNKAILCLEDKKFEDAVKHLENAIRLRKKRSMEYFRLSEYIKDGAERDISVRKLVVDGDSKFLKWKRTFNTE